MRKRRWLAAVLFLFGTGSLVAANSTLNPAAEASYRLGQKYHTAKQWGPAARAYLQAIKADAGAQWIYKALGTVYYQGGDRKGALACYERYLMAYPSDAATKNFAEKLRASLGQAPAASSASAAAPPPKGRSGFKVRLEGGAVMNSGQDIADIFNSSIYSVEAVGGMAVALGAGVDYAFPGGFITGLDLLIGPNRAYALDYSGVGATRTDTWTISTLSVLFTPGWQFKAGPLALEPRLGLGFMKTSVEVASSLGASSGTASAAGLAIWPQLRAEYPLGKFGLGLNLGYLIATLSPVKDEDGDVIQVFDSSGGSSDWAIKNSGFSFGLFVSYRFES